jgi:hypothetical protein
MIYFVYYHSQARRLFLQSRLEIQNNTRNGPCVSKPLIAHNMYRFRSAESWHNLTHWVYTKDNEKFSVHFVPKEYLSDTVMFIKTKKGFFLPSLNICSQAKNIMNVFLFPAESFSRYMIYFEYHHSQARRLFLQNKL